MARRHYHHHTSQSYEDSKCVDQFALIGGGIGVILGAILGGWIGAIICGFIFGFIGYIIGGIVVTFS